MYAPFVLFYKESYSTHHLRDGLSGDWMSGRWEEVQVSVLLRNAAIKISILGQTSSDDMHLI